MTMLFRHGPDPIDQLLRRTRRLYDEVRVAAMEVRQAAAIATDAHAAQHESADALAPEEETDARASH